MSHPVSVYRIKVSLEGTDPLVWRELEVLSNMSLNSLAFAVNEVMGWKCCHLYLFEWGDRELGNPDYDENLTWEDDGRIQVHKVAFTDKPFHYVYDFGDDWRHSIEFITEGPVDRNERYPKCTGGANACPPEDCGGVHAFQEYKTAIADAAHERHRELLDWRGPFDPEEFDMDLTNLSLTRKKVPKNLKIKNLNEIQPEIIKATTREVMQTAKAANKEHKDAMDRLK